MHGEDMLPMPGKEVPGRFTEQAGRDPPRTNSVLQADRAEGGVLGFVPVLSPGTTRIADRPACVGYWRSGE